MSKVAKRDLLGSSPRFGSPIALKVATDKSIELSLLHVGQSSATVAVTVYTMFGQQQQSS